MEKGKLIGIGNTAEVYEWGQDKVLKLYLDKFGEEWINYEFIIGRTVNKAGVPSPVVFDKVEIEGRKGIVFQRIFGRTVFERLETEPWRLYHYTQQMAALHSKVHKCTANTLITQKQRFSNTIKLSSEILGDKAGMILDYVDCLPGGKSVCHGDLHFNNVIVTNNGLVAIDWNGAYMGNPLSDVARTCLIITSPFVPPGTPDITAKLAPFVRPWIYWTYIQEYMRCSKARFEDIDAWMLPVAAAKLKDKIPGEEKWLMDIIEKRLKTVNLNRGV